MANKTLFSSIKSKFVRTDTYNEAGGRAYKFTPKHALAQMAATGCFNGVFYASAQSQLDEMRKLIDQVDDNVFLAKLAVYARERAYMKDMPAALLVVLSKRDTELLHQVFDRVVDNGRVLRTMFQMIRSGQFGRTSLSSSLQRAYQRWKVLRGMPSCSSVRFAGRCEPSTRRMISSFSAAGYLMRSLPHPRACFF